MAPVNDRRLIAGMVGGGAGAMIGAAHRHGMWLDNQYVLAAGVFGRDTRSSREFAHGLGVERVYDDYREMALVESRRRDGVDVVAVVTPNDTHYEIASAFLKKGISVVCEKPLTNEATTAAALVDARRVHRRHPRGPPHLLGLRDGAPRRTHGPRWAPRPHPVRRCRTRVRMGIVAGRTMAHGP